MDKSSQDTVFMEKAIELAKTAAEQGEVPVGAIVVDPEGRIIASAYNQRERNKSATAHAEILAIEQACRVLGTWRLSGCSLYVTLEPCPMCAGAVVNSRIERVIYGADDRLAGCCKSLINFNAYPFNHAFEITDGVCKEKCTEILQSFFKGQRKRKEPKV